MNISVSDADGDDDDKSRAPLVNGVSNDDDAKFIHDDNDNLIYDDNDEDNDDSGGKE